MSKMKIAGVLLLMCLFFGTLGAIGAFLALVPQAWMRIVACLFVSVVAGLVGWVLAKKATKEATEELEQSRFKQAQAAERMASEREV